MDRQLTHTATLWTPFGPDQIIQIRETPHYWVNAAGRKYSKDNAGHALRSARCSSPEQIALHTLHPMSGTVDVMLPEAWRTDRAERELPDGEVIGRKGRGVVVQLSREDAAEMLSDAAHYADDGTDGPAYVIRAAKVALPRLRAALNVS